MTTNYDTAFWQRLDESLGRERLEMAEDAPKKSTMFTHFDDLVAADPNWLIEGLIEQETLCMNFGAAGSGKSFVSIDMALCIATGRDYHGHAVDAGTVFYICGEGHSGFARRTNCWAKSKGVGKGETNFYKSNKSIIMSDPAAVKLLKDEMELLVAEAGVAPKLVVIDTLARSLGAASENDGKDVNLFIEACDDIVDTYKCAVMLVHHTGHGSKERARGASQINAALDHEFRVEKWGDNKVLVTFTKQKEDAPPAPMGFLKVPTEVVVCDETLRSVSSIVLEKVDDLPEGGDGLSAACRHILSILVDGDGTARDVVRDAYIETMGSGNRDSDRRRFNNNLRVLLENGHIEQIDGYLHKTKGKSDD